MSSDPKNPRSSDLAIDATELSAIIVDLETGAMQGMRTAQDGLEETLEEILVNQSTDGARAGVSDSLIEELTGLGTSIASVDRFLPAARKLVELLTETRAKLEDDRYQIISAVANMVDRRATRAGNGDLLARYEKTRTYRSAIGVKAAKTREKNSLEQSASAPPA